VDKKYDINRIRLNDVLYLAEFGQIHYRRKPIGFPIFFIACSYSLVREDVEFTIIDLIMLETRGLNEAIY
jgi:hypothetical protein